MTKILMALKGESVATMAIVTAALGILTLTGVMDQKLSGAIAVLVGAILAFPVRGIVTPVTTAVGMATQAAQTAAETVAKQIDAPTAGVAGQITDAAVDLVKTAVAGSVPKTWGAKHAA